MAPRGVSALRRYMKLMQTSACCSFPNSAMLVRPLESLQESRAVISLGVDSGLAGPIFY
jgi:hypothetical protein